MRIPKATPTQQELERFAILLQDRRKSAGHSREDLAKLAGVSAATIKSAENAILIGRGSLLRLLQVEDLALRVQDAEPLFGGILPGDLAPRPGTMVIGNKLATQLRRTEIAIRQAAALAGASTHPFAPILEGMASAVRGMLPQQKDATP